MSGPTIFTARRMDGDGVSSLARWFDPAGTPLCWALEPGPERLPHPMIPAGTYPLRLRTGTPKDAEYLKRFGSFWHKGMIEIAEVPGRTAIEFHIGNSISDTEGCSLAGLATLAPAHSASLHWEVTQSLIAYQRVYPRLRDAVLGGGAVLTILAMDGS